RWIRAGGPSQTVAVICRHTVWTRPPEPDDLANEGLWCQPFLGTATGCEVLRASKPQSIKWARATDRKQRHDTVTVVPQSRSENALFSGHRRCTGPAPCGFVAALGRR